MPDHHYWMNRCLELARLGAGNVAPNPMVGAVLVQQGNVLAEGWHYQFGGPHAEVDCLNKWGVKDVPEDAVLYVNLEPCAHHGKTPPCSDLLITRGVNHVVVGLRDPFPLVAGKGIQRLKDAGIRVTEGIIEDECKWQQRRFLTSITQERPYVILKWARSADHFLDRSPKPIGTVQRISNAAMNVLVHTWRSEEQAILVGSRTVVNDDPALTTRLVQGRSPIRVILDRSGITSSSAKVYDKEAPTVLFTEEIRAELDVEQCVLPKGGAPLKAMLKDLNSRPIRSILVEGGAELLGHFIADGLWDEARVITGRQVFKNGTPAPILKEKPLRSTTVDGDRLDLYLNGRSTGMNGFKPAAEWYW